MLRRCTEFASGPKIHPAGGAPATDRDGVESVISLPGPPTGRTVSRVSPDQLTRRRLLTCVGAAAVAAGLPGCGSNTVRAPQPTGAAQASPPVPTAARTVSDDAELRRKIASLLVVGFRGARLSQNDWILRAIRSGLGGVILFDRDLQTKGPRNISSAGQVRALVETLRDASPGRLIVSIDQEGGRTSRLNPDRGFPATKSQAEIGAENSPAATRAWARTIVDTLRSVGVNLNYAPVVDLNLNPDSPAIGRLGRSFSANPDVVVSNATEEIQVHRAGGVKTVIKHFPGSGSATGNTDFEVVDVSSTWQRSELEPFQRLIAGGVTDSVMAAHVLNRQLDPNRPASLSPAVVTDLLRGKLGWQGPVVSDDMQAVAISRRYAPDEAVALALEAGLDLLVFANQQVYNTDVVDRTLDSVVNLVRTGRITQARIDQSVSRVDALRPRR
jgi:beta-N-acetylhexosaminidase